MATHTIVLADDDRAIRDLLTHHLEREGFTVVGVADGNSALRLARGAADLLVLDVGLPGVDGYDVARTLRREDRSVPIVMVTARCDELDRVVGFELGADDYLCKRSCSRSQSGRSTPASSTMRSPTTRDSARATCRCCCAGTLAHRSARAPA